MKTDISIGVGKPASTRSSYAKAFALLSPGKFIEVGSTRDLLKVASSLRAYVRNRKLPWKVSLNSAERRIYVIAAE